jgi:hypothetical protein
MNDLKQVSTTFSIKLNTNKIYYDQEINIKLFSLGIKSGVCGNFELDKKISEKEIEQVADIISGFDGRYSYFKLWYSTPIESYRLVFGYKK